MNKTIFEDRGEGLIEQFGLTKAEFARKMGIQRQNVNAVFKSSKLETIRRVADALGTDLMYLLGYSEPIDLDDYPFNKSIESPMPYEILPEDVPAGDSIEERRERQRLIRRYYQQWFKAHPEAAIYNKSLHDTIHVNYTSVHETSGQASLSYLSTLAVLQLESILQNSVVIGETVPKKNNNSQKPFQKMILMRCFLPGIGGVKLVVGVKWDNAEKVQYCVTALRADVSKGSATDEFLSKCAGTWSGPEFDEVEKQTTGTRSIRKINKL